MKSKIKYLAVLLGVIACASMCGCGDNGGSAGTSTGGTSTSAETSAKPGVSEHEDGMDKIESAIRDALRQ